MGDFTSIGASGLYIYASAGPRASTSAARLKDHSGARPAQTKPNPQPASPLLPPRCYESSKQGASLGGESRDERKGGRVSRWSGVTCGRLDSRPPWWAGGGRARRARKQAPKGTDDRPTGSAEGREVRSWSRSGIFSPTQCVNCEAIGRRRGRDLGSHKQPAHLAS